MRHSIFAYDEREVILACLVNRTLKAESVTGELWKKIIYLAVDYTQITNAKKYTPLLHVEFSSAINDISASNMRVQFDYIPVAKPSRKEVTDMSWSVSASGEQDEVVKTIAEQVAKNTHVKGVEAELMQAAAGLVIKAVQALDKSKYTATVTMSGTASYGHSTDEQVAHELHINVAPVWKKQ